MSRQFRLRRLPAGGKSTGRLRLDGRECRGSIDAGCPCSIRIENSVYNKKLGILLNVPVHGGPRARPMPPLAESAARDLHRAFVTDLFARISRLKKIPTTVFHEGEDASTLQDIVPGRWPIVLQEGVPESNRIDHALGILLEREGNLACVIGAKCPDLPLVYLKRAYAKLKHRDVVLGPTFEGGLYLVALKRPVSGFLTDIAWNDPTALRGVLDRVQSKRISCALLPPWYDASSMENLSLLEALLLARRIEGRDRLRRVEKVLETMRRSG